MDIKNLVVMCTMGSSHLHFGSLHSCTIYSEYSAALLYLWPQQTLKISRVAASVWMDVNLWMVLVTQGLDMYSSQDMCCMHFKDLPSQVVPSLLTRNPCGHAHRKLPSVFLQRPPEHREVSKHSSTSAQRHMAHNSTGAFTPGYSWTQVWVVSWLLKKIHTQWRSDNLWQLSLSLSLSLPLPLSLIHFLSSSHYCKGNPSLHAWVPAALLKHS